VTAAALARRRHAIYRLEEGSSAAALAEEPMATSDDMRIGDSDRDAVAGALREHFAEGRLSMDELSERLDATFAATTRGELGRVTVDLPYVHQPVSANPRVVIPGGQRDRGPRRADRPRWRGGQGSWAGVPVLAFWLLILLVLVSATRWRFGFFGRGPGMFAVLLLAGLAFIRRLLRGCRGGGCGRRRRRPW
jgi:hypothetical protein